MKLNSTVGALLVNSVLPEDLRDYRRVLDVNGINELLRQVAEKHPEKYREISHALSVVGRDAAQSTGGNSFGIAALKRTLKAEEDRKLLQKDLYKIVGNKTLTEAQRDEALISRIGQVSKSQADEVYKQALADNNPLAYQVISGARGSKGSLASLLASDLLMVDHRNKVIPFPIMRSYSQGLSAPEYWAGSYSARAGTAQAKMAVRDAGYLQKVLTQIVHRQTISDLDSADAPATLRGYPVDIEDADSEGALLAAPAGKYKRNTILTPKIIADLKKQGLKRLLIRSPIVGGPEDGSVYARDVGVREFGRLPVRGEMPGIAAAHALAEPISQSQLKAKHSGGVAGAGASQLAAGFPLLQALIQSPKVFPSGATHSDEDGQVSGIEPAPAGGTYVYVDGKRHHVPTGLAVKVRRGDHVEAGDILSEGNPNPAKIVQHKGVGEGRAYFIQAFRDALRNSGARSHRRNIELLARGLINHVKLTEELGDFSPDDVVQYSTLEHSYQPRDGYKSVAPKQATGHYLERPYLHYSIGTKVRPSVIKNLDEFGVKNVDVHADPPPFEPVTVRGMANLSYDPDWMTQMYGSGLKGSLLKSVHRGATSSTTGTSFVPGLARSADFGQVGKIVPPDPANPYGPGTAHLLEPDDDPYDD